ncbi:triacylglycerol lipase [Ancylostoma caninum]|uniref:Triacylglycerol lipase n=1 Tax=Ancylostoma caninum TaxID=29170 RepID=A0A368FBN2_ANCCA|nr:triacylglycerol lipase [Ancylostoma caninum]
MLLPYILLFSCLATAVSHHMRVTNYNEALAKKLLGLAAAAYGNKPQACLDRLFKLFFRMFPSHDFHLVLSTAKKMCDIFGNTCEGYIAASDKKKQIFVVFRGSKTTGQIILQGLNSFTPVDFFGMGRVNRYFSYGVHVLWPSIKRVLKDLKYAGYKVAFTGHSLGGALATLAAARAARQGLRRGNEILVYTFGAPRVGDSTFAANFNRIIPNCYRVVFRHDIVPHLPPCTKAPNMYGQMGNTCTAGRSTPYHQGTEIW